jgi:hypothetical protein
MNLDTETELCDLPFLVRSPVEFILIATIGNKRKVVAQSLNAQIDLIAAAHSQDSRDSFKVRLPIHETISWIERLISKFTLPQNQEPVCIKSRAIVIPFGELIDDRLSSYTLVWRGSLDKDSVNYISLEGELDMNIREINKAIQDHSQADLEWNLAPIIDKINKINIQQKQRSKFLFLLGALSILYILIILIVIAFQIKKNDNDLPTPAQTSAVLPAGHPQRDGQRFRNTARTPRNRQLLGPPAWTQPAWFPIHRTDRTPSRQQARIESGVASTG